MATYSDTITSKKCFPLCGNCQTTNSIKVPYRRSAQPPVLESKKVFST